MSLIPRFLQRQWTDLNLRKKGAIVLLLPLLALLANTAATRILLNSERDADFWVKHTLEVRVCLQSIVLVTT
ncbi:MAG: hypothetical protein JOY92_01050, partial [Verrucomicrobia bacterium]|nr:hypothetical protein [Verrucomicrobiota bacterium]